MPVTSSPRIETSPSSGISSPAMTRSSVDFPLPLGPSSAVRDPLAIASETSSSATCLPKRFDTWRTAIDIRDLLVCAWLEDVHGDERDDREQRQHERGRVRRHLVETEILLVDVDGEGLGLAGEPAGDDRDRAVLAERAGGREHDPVRDSPADRWQRDAPERLRARRPQGPRDLLLVGAHLPEDRHDLADDERERYEHG